MRPWLLAPLIVMLLISCGSAPPQSQAPADGKHAALEQGLDVRHLPLGTDIKVGGEMLMALPMGLQALVGAPSGNDSVLVVLVHGYASEGYEWVLAAQGLVDRYGTAFLYRYDWERCPQEVATEMTQAIREQMRTSRYDRVLVFGHSYGGLITAFAASELEKVSGELHVIAAPLTGFPRLLDACTDLRYNAQDRLIIPPWDGALQVIQHRTVHAQDGACRDLASDPQVTDLPFTRVVELPPTMDGHRLGHNWSVTWVVDHHIGRPHHY